jgi:hypothetical protein
VLLAREVWSHLPETGEEGARHVIAAYPHLVEDLPLGEELPDLDDPGDYRLLMEADNCLWI